MAFEGSQVYRPESLAMAFCTNSRLVVRMPFSVTSEMPPLGESKLMSCERNRSRLRERNVSANGYRLNEKSLESAP